MFENKSYFKIKTGTERNFGLVFATIFAIIGLYPLWHSENVRISPDPGRNPPPLVDQNFLK